MFANAHMLITGAEIAVENATSDEMRALVLPLLGARCSLPGSFLLLAYDIFDSTDAYAQWDSATEVLGIGEGNAFLREFDILPFAVKLTLNPQSSLLLRLAVPVVAEWIARRLACETGRRTLLTFNGGEIPFALYAGQKKLEDFSRFYEPILGPRMTPELDDMTCCPR